MVCLSLLVLALPVHAGMLDGEGPYNFSRDVASKIGAIESAKREALSAKNADEPSPQITEGDLVRSANRAIEQVLSSRLSLPTTATSAGRPRDLDRELAQIIATEKRALGKERRFLNPPDPPRSGDDRAPFPIPRHFRDYELVHQVRVGVEGSELTSAEATPCSSSVRFAEYKLTYNDRPAPRSTLFVDNSLYLGSRRTSDTGIVTLDHWFNHRWSGSLGGLVIVDRYIPEEAVNDSLLGHGYEIVTLHLPEGLDVSERLSYERRLFERETPFTLSTRTKVFETRAEKRMRGGTFRMEFESTSTDYPSDRSQSLLRTDLSFGYAAALSRKIELDYVYVLEKENCNLSSGDLFFDGASRLGDYAQGTNRLTMLFRFSPIMSLTMDLELENRNYKNPDPVFLSYNRNLWRPVFRVQQTHHLSWSLGYMEETFLYRPVDWYGVFLSSDCDYRVFRYSGSLDYSGKRLSASIGTKFGPTHYLNVQQTVQSDFDTHDTVLMARYGIGDDTSINALFTRTSRVFHAFAEHNDKSDVFTTDVRHRF